MRDTVRLAVHADIAAIAEMGVRFAADEYQQRFVVKDAGVRQAAATMIDAPTCGVWVAERAGAIVGMIAGTVYQHPMSLEQLAIEVAWWMEPAARGGRTALRLLEAFKSWARTQGAVRLHMIAPTEHVAWFYERLGFDKLETCYQVAL